ncbi:MAG: dTMP kinase [Rickettsiaceae bacterium]
MKNIKYAKFITFEGGESSGKSTQSKLLYEYFKASNIPVILTREIGGVNTAEDIRELILSHNDLLPMTELMLVMAARNEHVQKTILPALNEGITVICDRFVDSTACYQGYHNNIGIKATYDMHKNLIGDIMPDITFFLNLAPEAALKRLSQRHEINRFDLKDAKFYAKIQEAFHLIEKRFPYRIKNIDTNYKNIKEIHIEIIKHLELSAVS